MWVLLATVLLVTASGIVLWVDLDAVMREATEMERNLHNLPPIDVAGNPHLHEDVCTGHRP